MNITKGGVGSWAKEAVFAILMLLFAQTSSIATTVQSNIKLMASKHLKQNLQECIFAFVSPALELSLLTMDNLSKVVRDRN